jgi:hypothetical protein
MIACCFEATCHHRATGAMFERENCADWDGFVQVNDCEKYSGFPECAGEIGRYLIQVDCGVGTTRASTAEIFTEWVEVRRSSFLIPQ